MSFFSPLWCIKHAQKLKMDVFLISISMLGIELKEWHNPVSVITGWNNWQESTLKSNEGSMKFLNSHHGRMELISTFESFLFHKLYFKGFIVSFSLKIDFKLNPLFPLLVANLTGIVKTADQLDYECI